MPQEKNNNVREFLRAKLPNASEADLDLAEDRYRDFLKALCALYLAKKRQLAAKARRDSEESV